MTDKLPYKIIELSALNDKETKAVDYVVGRLILELIFDMPPEIFDTEADVDYCRVVSHVIGREFNNRLAPNTLGQLVQFGAFEIDVLGSEGRLYQNQHS